ncbi:microcystin-dependent protein [Acidovorax soli]|uniref:Microcystin-dependent protein n=1 Tax=Acidovorax soli TaxID=592050 RepID=A0A7X0P8W8_9BURK|nr:tail fiber protein [Acidovorax soli]MBB6557440.1 microcystin-dependent protein [Acidovorax soli]
MTTPFLGEITLCAFPFAPRGWAFCSGQMLPISQNTALFSLLGTTYGGNGQTTFALPDLRGRRPMGMGTSTLGSSYQQGQQAGVETVTLTLAQIPSHTHALNAVSGVGTSSSPQNAHLAASAVDSPYTDATAAGINTQLLAPAGGTQPHNNLPPFLVMNFVIALQGVFPSRN